MLTPTRDRTPANSRRDRLEEEVSKLVMSATRISGSGEHQLRAGSGSIGDRQERGNTAPLFPHFPS